MLNVSNSGVFLTGLGRFPTYDSGRRHLLAGIELAGPGLTRYNAALGTVCPGARPVAADQIATAGRKVLDAAAEGIDADFVRRGMDAAVQLRRMRKDGDWTLPTALGERIGAVLGYLGDPAKLIPDSAPVIAHFDDAMLVDQLQREIAGELEDYADFCAYREEVADGAAGQVTVEEWLEARWHACSAHRARRRVPYAIGSCTAFRVR
ncbi:MAG TPA: hypothetical protein VFG21_03985 [Xanthomonadaceae bacterium]|nr:hypothetical protein [Xanthomonadaceae bacterium]